MLPKSITERKILMKTFCNLKKYKMYHSEESIRNLELDHQLPYEHPQRAGAVRQGPLDLGNPSIIF